MKRFILSALFFIALLSIWHLLVLAKVWSPVLLPDPISVWEYLKGAAGDGTLVQASLVTMRRLLAGYVIGIAAGLPLGLLTARFKFCEDTIGVLALGLQTLPSVCWVPLALLWFGQTETGFGLGHLLHYGRELNAMDQVIGVMLVIVVIGLLADKIVFAPWERFLHRRWGTGRA